MEYINISNDKSEKLKKIGIKINLVYKKIFKSLSTKKLLKIIRYNKQFQKILNIDINFFL